MGSCLNQQGHAPWEALQPPGGELRLFHHTAPEAGFGTSPSPSLSLHQANSRAQQKAAPPPLEMSPQASGLLGGELGTPPSPASSGAGYPAGGRMQTGSTTKIPALIMGVIEAVGMSHTSREIFFFPLIIIFLLFGQFYFWSLSFLPNVKKLPATTQIKPAF